MLHPLPRGLVERGGLELLTDPQPTVTMNIVATNARKWDALTTLADDRWLGRSVCEAIDVGLLSLLWDWARSRYEAWPTMEDEKFTEVDLSQTVFTRRSPFWY